jgi:hypothetical protein
MHYATQVTITFSCNRSFMVFSNLLARFTLRYLTKGLMVIPCELHQKKKNVFLGFLITGFSVSDSNLLIPGRRP